MTRLPPDSTLESSNGKNEVLPQSSPLPSLPSSSLPDPNSALAPHGDDTAISIGSKSTVTDPPKDDDQAIGNKLSYPSLSGGAVKVEPPAVDRPRDPSLPGGDEDFKRVGKMAYNATLGVIAISVTLLMSIPHQIESDRLNLYACTAAFACLSLITSFGLMYFSIVNPVGQKLAWVQKRVMMLYCSLMVFAVFSRMAAVFTLVYVVFILVSTVSVIGLVILYLYLAWQAEKKDL